MASGVFGGGRGWMGHLRRREIALPLEEEGREMVDVWGEGGQVGCEKARGEKKKKQDASGM